VIDIITALKERKANLRLVIIRAGETKGPSTGKYWLFLQGIIRHVNGTYSDWRVQHKQTGVEVYKTGIISTVATGIYPLWNTNATNEVAQAWIAIINDEYEVVFDGGSGAYIWMVVLEF